MFIALRLLELKAKMPVAACVYDMSESQHKAASVQQNILCSVYANETKMIDCLSAVNILILV